LLYRGRQGAGQFGGLGARRIVARGHHVLGVRFETSELAQLSDDALADLLEDGGDVRVRRGVAGRKKRAALIFHDIDRLLSIAKAMGPILQRQQRPLPWGYHQLILDMGYDQCIQAEVNALCAASHVNYRHTMALKREVLEPQDKKTGTYLPVRTQMPEIELFAQQTHALPHSQPVAGKSTSTEISKAFQCVASYR